MIGPPAVSRLGAMPSPFRLRATPVLVVMLGSMLGTLLPVIAQSPSLPPFGLVFLLTWRLLHPSLLPLWVGVPLGAFDDVMTGAPLGSAMFLWSIALVAIEAVEQRILWRDYWHDWLIVAAALAFCLLGGVVIAHIGGSGASFALVLPQWLWSALAYPLIVRLIARVDRWRIMA